MIETSSECMVDRDLDAQLRNLLMLCFPHEPLFRTRRFFRERPTQRWFIRNGEGMAAHLCIHRKVIKCAAGSMLIGGVAEVCVHPEFRGRGLVREILNEAHGWMRGYQYEFGMLFGNTNVYASSGYMPILNSIRHYDMSEQCWKVETFEHAMFRPLGQRKWPDGEIGLGGPTF